MIDKFILASLDKSIAARHFNQISHVEPLAEDVCPRYFLFRIMATFVCSVSFPYQNFSYFILFFAKFQTVELFKQICCYFAIAKFFDRVSDILSELSRTERHFE